ncbi:MAG TPA: alpha/beta hydrolase [Ohtaekwangia sp.]
MTSRRLVKITFPVLLLIGIYFLGPEPDVPVFNPAMPVVPGDPVALENYVNANEKKHQVKPGNEAEIVWYDSAKQKTEYAVVYLHGYTASKMEGDPTHRRFAKTFGANLYLSRLADHGIDTTETLLLFTADRFWESAKEALAIGKQLGHKVILIGTSTGSTVALKLAADYPEDVYAMINLSPNAGLRDPAAFLLNDPWGLYIARAVLGGKYRVTNASEEHAKYWNKKSRIESLTELEQLLETTMTNETFQRVKQPVLNLYYYKNDEEQDSEVSVEKILWMHDQLGTSTDMKQAVAFPEAGAHVIGAAMSSKDLEGVNAAIEKFAVEKLGLVKH